MTCIRYIICIALVGGAILGCNKKNDDPVSPIEENEHGTLDLGSSVVITTQPFGPSGGTYVVNRPGDPIDGLTIIVPDQAYTQTVNFTLSYKPVTRCDSTKFRSIAPVIVIENGGVTADKPIEISIPVHIAADEIAAGCYYDETTQKFEGLPTVQIENGKMTVVASHFSNITAVAANKSILQMSITTGFAPGVDDWQFVNRGSWLEPAGHCAGQSIGAMWYYYEKKLKGFPKLHDQYDNSTPLIWEDDAAAYKFCSMIQQNLSWNNWAYDIFSSYRGFKDSLTFSSLALMMYLTGEPQYISLRKTGGTAGHAIICHRIDNGSVYVTDPNYPGVERRIIFENGKFTPYNSGENAETIAQKGETAYDLIGYFAKTALIRWSQIGTLWNRLDFTKNTVSSDPFPAITVGYKNTTGAWVPLPDELVVTDKLLEVAVFDDATSSMTETSWRVYREDGTRITTMGGLRLTPGKNKYGFAAFYNKTVNSDVVSRWAGFQWLTIEYNAIPKITGINPSSGPVGTIVTIEGENFGTSRNTSTVMFNGVEAGDYISWNDSTILAKVPQTTTGNIAVTVEGKPSNAVLFTLTVQDPFLDDLRNTFKFLASINGDILVTYNDGGTTTFSSTSVGNTLNGLDDEVYTECPLVWNGTAFSIKGIHVRSDYQRDDLDISGLVSADGRTITQVTVKYHYYSLSSTTLQIEDEDKVEFTLSGIPLYIRYGNDFEYLTMSSPASKISNFYWYRKIGSMTATGTLGTVFFVNVNFRAP
jgi:hypothetical protein